MKKLIIALAVFAGTVANAQNQRFSYEYKFVSDSTNRENIKSEILVLDTFPEGSKFYNYENFRADSIMAAEIDKQVKSGNFNINLSDIKKSGVVNYTVEKKYPDYSILYFNKMGADEYMVQDSRTQNWQISSEKQKIGELNTQKATCDFGGRKWTAWFSSEIPIQDGPYKFHGLPGLIVKLEDATKSHVFELKGIKTLNDNKWVAYIDSKKRGKSPIALDEKKFKKAFIEYRNDPNKGTRSMISQGVIAELRDASGNVIDMKQMMKDREKKQLEANKKNNNVLELDLLQ